MVISLTEASEAILLSCYASLYVDVVNGGLSVYIIGVTDGGSIERCYVQLPVDSSGARRSLPSAQCSAESASLRALARRSCYAIVTEAPFNPRRSVDGVRVV